MRGWSFVFVALGVVTACDKGASPLPEGSDYTPPPAFSVYANTGGFSGSPVQQPPAGQAQGGVPGVGGAPSGGLPPNLGGGGAVAAGGAPVPFDAGSKLPPPASTDDPGKYVPPPDALPDISFEMQSTVAPGGESLMCRYAAMPSDRGVIAVPSAESEFTPGSHHLLAYRTDLTSIPSGMTDVFPCSDGSWMVHMRGSYYEAQQPMSRRDLPPGVAHRFQPGEVVVIQTHYLNPATDPLLAHATLTLHTVAVSSVPSEAGSIMFSDVNINIPAGGKARSTMTCPIPTDFNPALLWSHMHKQGINFVATTDDANAAALLGTLYEEKDWSEPHPRAYPYSPPVTLHAGSHITFSCDFQNPTASTLTFGQSAETNEMCILHGMYWPRMTSNAEQCYGGQSTRTAL